MKVVKRIRFSDEAIQLHRDYYPGISFQKFVEICVENERNRVMKKRIRPPF